MTINTTMCNASYNYTTATIPDASGAGKVFARLRATLPSTYTGTINGSNASGENRSAVTTARKK